MQQPEDTTNQAIPETAPAPVPAAHDAPEEEKKGEPEEEKKDIHEAAVDEDLSKIFVKLDSGVPSDVIPSICMECKA